jgi:hypothetical protein
MKSGSAASVEIVVLSESELKLALEYGSYTELAIKLQLGADKVREARLIDGESE